MPTRRIQRVNQLLREEIADLLRREIKDETLNASLISITEVDTAPDLSNAKVYYSVYGDEENQKLARQHLERATNFLRRQLIGRLDLRYVPKLEFVFDRSLEEGARIMSLLRGIENEGGTNEPDDKA
jgi:ribosome-binding factor A